MKIKLLVIALSAAVLLGAGWQTRAWYEDSRNLTAERARQEVLDAVRSSIASVGELVEQQRSDLRVKERVIDRGVIREVQKIIYRERECFEPDLVRLLNLGAQGRSADVSGELTDGLPRDPSHAD